MTPLTRSMSRPLRLASLLAPEPDIRLEERLTRGRVAVRLQPGFEADPDATTAVAFAVDLLIRCCGDTTVVLPHGSASVQSKLQAMRIAWERRRRLVVQLAEPDWAEFNAVLNIGTECRSHLSWVTVNSTGWLARVASDSSTPLHWAPAPPNVLGALASACMGVAQVFLRLLGQNRDPVSRELSVLTGEIGTPGFLAPGPNLPDRPLTLDALLVGCGGVSTGWAYAVKRLPIVGAVQAIDREVLSEENLGPYVGTTWENVGVSKSEVIRRTLEPLVGVTPRAEEFEFFRIRLERGLLSIPPLVVNGVDNVQTRHAVQRLWPGALIDMAAGGVTTQLIVKLSGSPGMCLLTAFRLPENEADRALVLERTSGIRADRIVNSPTDYISQEDVAAAPRAVRPMLDAARRQRRLICGYITEINLRQGEPPDDFAAAAPFISGMSGVLGAAATMRHLMGIPRETHLQLNLQAIQAQALSMICPVECPCQRK